MNKLATTFLCGIFAALSASFCFARETYVGISTVEPGVTVTRYVLGDASGAGWPNGWGKTSNGTEILVQPLDDIDALVVAGNYFSSMTMVATKRALAGYTINFTGDFNYDDNGNGATDGGYPIGRWDRQNYSYYTMEGKISVPVSGKWTFSFCGREEACFSVEIKKGGNVVLSDEKRGSWGGRAMWTLDLVEGEYDIKIRQYSNDASVYYEFSAAQGEVANFSVNDFRIVGSPLTAYSVTFDANGGTTVAAQTVLEGRAVSVPDQPTKIGHAFRFWTADASASSPEPYDFASPVNDDLTLTAVWVENSSPVVQPISVTPARVFLNGSSAKFTLSADASDADVGDVLTYSWTVVDEPSVSLSISSPDAASTEVTAFGAGTFTFQVVVSDGHEWVSERVDVAVEATADSTTFSFVGAEYTESQNWLPTGSNAYDHSDPKYAWEYAKSEWRSTGTSAKAYLIDNKRENAYGLDGYVFPGKCEVQSGDSAFNISSGTEYFDETEGVHTLVFSNVTEYVSSFEFYPKVTRGYMDGTFCELGADAQNFAIDDPRQPVGESVSLFRPGSIAIKLTDAQKNEFLPFAKITFSGKISRHAKVRIGILASGNNNFKPKFMSVGGAVAEWGGQRNSQEGMPDFLFFDVDNAKSGGTVILSLKQSDNNWNTAILNGVIFDSTMKKPGLAIVVR